MFSPHFNYSNKILIIIIIITLNGLLTSSIVVLNTLNEQQQHRHHDWRTKQFNSELCDHFTLNTLSYSLNVTLTFYSDIYQYIPEISIIIVVHNENALILENTIKSILVNTSSLLWNNNLKEIILIDDDSNPPVEEDQIKSLSKIVSYILTRNKVVFVLLFFG
ncbi:unnamed protein product [Schistosoma turkestanicum]|nr:unnamed protein product [Schistosoma turkestanicum]